MITLSAAVVVVAGALTGGFVTGLAGFGTGLVALGFWLHVIAPAPASTLVAVCSVAGQLQGMRGIGRHIDTRRVVPMLLAGLVGVPIGTLLLSRIDLDVFKLGTGLLLVGFSAFMLLGRWQPRLTWGGRGADGAIGFGGGILGGLAGLSGPLPIIWATLRGWTREERRAVFQAFNTAILAAVVVWHAISGLLTAEVLQLALIALPGTFVGAWLGGAAYRRLSDRRFDQVVLGLLAFSGLTLVWAGLRPG